MQLRVGFTPEPQITPRVSNTKQSHEDLRKLARRDRDVEPCQAVCREPVREVSQT